MQCIPLEQSDARSRGKLTVLISAKTATTSARSTIEPMKRRRDPIVPESITSNQPERRDVDGQDIVKLECLVVTLDSPANVQARVA